MKMPLNLLGTDFGYWQMSGVVGGPTHVPSTWADRYDSWGVAATKVQDYIPKGYQRTRPGNPRADLGQFLIELRDIPKLPLTKGLFKVSKRPGKYGFRTVSGVPFQEIPRELFRNLTSLRNLGSEYLNVVFGWKPLLSDLRKMYYLWQDVDRRMGQIIRENGKAISRRANVETSSTLDVVDGPTAQPFAYYNIWGGVPNFPTFEGTTVLTHLKRTYARVWYMAKYQYYIPDVGSSLWTTRARAALFGVLPTPALLWEVLPWSWLIDWFTNVGDIYSNISPNAVDNLVTLYSYTMKNVKTYESWHAHVHHSAGTAVWSHPGCDAGFASYLSEETKLRFPGGSPFTLNTKLADFSPYQLGVLAALGLSRGGKHIS